MSILQDTRGPAQALFQKTGDDGAHWLFIVLGGGGWVITRDGERMASGSGRGASLVSGVHRFLSLTLAVMPAGTAGGEPAAMAIPA